MITVTNLQRLKARTARISTTIAFSKSPEKTTASSAIIVNPIPFFREIGVISRETEIKPESRMITVTKLQRLKARTVRISTTIAVSESPENTNASSAIVVNPIPMFRDIGEKAVPTTNSKID